MMNVVRAACGARLSLAFRKILREAGEDLRVRRGPSTAFGCRLTSLRMTVRKGAFPFALDDDG